jgi:uncharacterized protein (DUF488 family)
VASPLLYTIGYEGAAIEELIGALKDAGVTRLLDIRSSPYSKRAEFSRDELARALSAYAIAYEHLPALGNPPAGREAARAGHMAAYREIFTAHLNGPEGQAGLAYALGLAAREPVCLLCFERSHLHCHRSMVVARMEAMTGGSAAHLRISARQAHPAQAAFSF